MFWTNFSHCLGQKHDRKSKIEKIYVFFHPVKAVQSFTIRQGRRFEKKPTRSTCPRVGHLYYYGTLFLGAKIFMGHFLLYDLKHMLKSLLMRPWFWKFFEKKIKFWMNYGHFRLLLHDALTNWPTLFVNVLRRSWVRIPFPATKRPLGLSWVQV